MLILPFTAEVLRYRDVDALGAAGLLAAAFRRVIWIPSDSPFPEIGVIYELLQPGSHSLAGDDAQGGVAWK